MIKLFSARERATTWRRSATLYLIFAQLTLSGGKLWLWLAIAEKKLGLDQISDKAIEAIRANLVVTDEAFKVIAKEVSGLEADRRSDDADPARNLFVVTTWQHTLRHLKLMPLMLQELFM